MERSSEAMPLPVHTMREVPLHRRTVCGAQCVFAGGAVVPCKVCVACCVSAVKGKGRGGGQGRPTTHVLELLCK